MKKMLSVMLAVMLMMSLLAVPALADDQVLTVVTWDTITTPYLIAQKEAFEASHPGVTIEYVDAGTGKGKLPQLPQPRWDLDIGQIHAVEERSVTDGRDIV